MPGQLSTYKLEGQTRQPFRDSKNIELEANFGLENTADLTLSNAIFSNNDKSLDRDFIQSKADATPLEGIDVTIEISDVINGVPFNFDFEFFTDWRKLIDLSDNSLSVGLKNRESVISFDKRAAGVTFALLEDKNLLNVFDYSNIPYIVENRKTELEKIQLLVQAFIIFKSIADEIFKIINIAADISTLGVAQALVNLTLTIANLILLIQKLGQLIGDIIFAFFPPVLYHSGIKPKVFLQKTVEYLGYDAIEFGSHIPIGATKSFGEIMDAVTWCPSKNDEVGIPMNVLNPVSGALKAGDFGYNAAATMELLVKKYNLKRGIIDNVVHLKPKSDPFWLQSAGAPEPTALVEDTPIYTNGQKHRNYEEFFSNTIEEYATDDSDYWSNVDLADENNPASGDKIISGVIVEPISVTNQKRVISEQGIKIDIPHALCTRKDVLDDLIDLMGSLVSELNGMGDVIKEQFDTVVSLLGTNFPQVATILSTFGGRSGVMKVENHFFTTAKCVFLEEIDTGLEIAPRIPVDFADHIGARALIEHYQNYNSFVPGVRNPNNLDDTNAKDIFEDVKIHMNIEKFTQILNNPYFSTTSGSEGKYHTVKWNVDGDFAIVTFWKQEPWMKNVEQKTIQ